MYQIYRKTDLRKLIFQFILFFTIGFTSDQSYVLMVSFDGFRHDFTTMTDTPNFDKLEEEGVKAEALIPVFPSLTFPNHYSIATGAYSGTHNITGNSFYDKEFREKYSLYDREKVRDPKFYKSEPIWVTAERQGVNAASYYWVGTEAPIKGRCFYSLSFSCYPNRFGSIKFWVTYLVPVIQTILFPEFFIIE